MWCCASTARDAPIFDARSASGGRDHVVRWPKPAHMPACTGRVQYRAVPDVPTLREIKAGGRVLAQWCTSSNLFMQVSIAFNEPRASSYNQAMTACMP